MIEITVDGKEYQLADSVTIIGRGDMADIQIENGKLSRTHVRFMIEGDILSLEDLGSKNGTFINGRKITEKTPFTKGDQIKLGDLAVKVELPGAAPAPAPAAAPTPAAAQAGKASRQDRAAKDKQGALIKNGILAAIGVIVLLVVYANWDTWFMPAGKRLAQDILDEVEAFVPRMAEPEDLTLKELQRVKDDLDSISPEYPEEYRRARKLIDEVSKVIAVIKAEQAAAALERKAREAFESILARYESGMANEESAIRELRAFKLNFPESPAAEKVEGRIRKLQQAVTDRWTQALTKAEADVDGLISQKAFRSARDALEGYMREDFSEGVPAVFAERVEELQARAKKITKACTRHFDVFTAAQLSGLAGGDPEQISEAISREFDQLGFEENRPALDRALTQIKAAVERRLAAFRKDMDRAEKFFKERSYRDAADIYRALIDKAGSDKGLRTNFTKKFMLSDLYDRARQHMIAYTGTHADEIEMAGFGTVSAMDVEGIKVALEGQSTTFAWKRIGEGDFFMLLFNYALKTNRPAVNAACGLLAMENNRSAVADRYITKAVAADPDLKTRYGLLFDDILMRIAVDMKRRKEEDVRRRAELAKKREEMKKKKKEPMAAVGARIWPDLMAGTPGKVPAWPTPKGGQRVNSVSALSSAIHSRGSRKVILLADGDYVMREPMPIRFPMTICGASKDPTKVRIIGDGFENGRLKDLLAIYADDVTIAHVTIMNARWNGIIVQGPSSPQRTQIYNCRFLDVSERCIKGSGPPPDGPYPDDGFIKYCYFENTKIPLRNHFDNGNYTTAIDMMGIGNWVISDNVIYNFRGRDGLGRAGIFLWQGLKDVTIERNLIINCDRGIAFGNGQAPSNKGRMRGEGGLRHSTGGIVRNNVIYRQAGYNGTATGDTGIEFVFAVGFKCYYNTVFIASKPRSGHIEHRFPVTSGEIFNNLSSGQILKRGSGDVKASNNGTVNSADLFLNPTKYDLHIKPGKSPSGSSKVLQPGTGDYDMDGQLRSPKSTVGADQR
ncbi:FHA domain-containing protein [Planctomycetota bacterium]